MSSTEDQSGKLKSSWFFKQSSELEMLISAAIIFTALQISDVISKGIISLINSNFAFDSQILGVLAIVGLYMSTLLPISIVVHFLLRIFWLSLVGLHSAFPDKETVDDSYTDKFSKIINDALNFEKLIHQLDKLSSSIFAFSFLTLFSFCFPVITLSTIVYAINALTSISILDNVFGQIVSGTLTAIIVISFLMYIIDFLTFGWFKKISNKRFQAIYLPIYRLVSILSLAFIYRGIFYKISANVSRKAVTLIIMGYLLVGVFFLNAGYHVYELYPMYNLNGSLDGTVISGRHYADQLDDSNIIIDPFIKEFVVNSGQNHVELNFPLNYFLEDSLLSQCEGVKKFAQRGVHWRQWFTVNNINTLQKDSSFVPARNAHNILDCFDQKMKVYIDDSIQLGLTYYFARPKRPKRALLRTFIPISNLDLGDHMIKIESQELSGKYRVFIPFLKD